MLSILEHYSYSNIQIINSTYKLVSLLLSLLLLISLLFRSIVFSLLAWRCASTMRGLLRRSLRRGTGSSAVTTPLLLLLGMQLPAAYSGGLPGSVAQG